MAIKENSKERRPYTEYSNHLDYVRANIELIRLKGVKKGLGYNYYSWAKAHKLTSEVNRVLKDEFSYIVGGIRTGVVRRRKSSPVIDAIVEQEGGWNKAGYRIDIETGRKIFSPEHIERYNRLVEVYIEMLRKQGKSEADIEELATRLTRKDDELEI